MGKSFLKGNHCYDGLMDIYALIISENFGDVPADKELLQRFFQICYSKADIAASHKKTTQHHRRYRYQM